MIVNDGEGCGRMWGKSKQPEEENKEQNIGNLLNVHRAPAAIALPQRAAAQFTSPHTFTASNI